MVFPSPLSPSKPSFGLSGRCPGVHVTCGVRFSFPFIHSLPPAIDVYQSSCVCIWASPLICCVSNLVFVYLCFLFLLFTNLLLMYLSNPISYIRLLHLRHLYSFVRTCFVPPSTLEYHVVCKAFCCCCCSNPVSHIYTKHLCNSVDQSFVSKFSSVGLE